jgi:hypothetical protein
MCRLPPVAYSRKLRVYVCVWRCVLLRQPAQVHGASINWTLDPTFDPDYSGNDGAIQPMILVRSMRRVSSDT